VVCLIVPLSHSANFTLFPSFSVTFLFH
jgi:hypothetical protein